LDEKILYIWREEEKRHTKLEYSLHHLNISKELEGRKEDYGTFMGKMFLR
jgi:hypothetical protein